MAYDELEQYFLDINWYFKDYFNRICIAASGGGILPSIILENDQGNEQFHQIVFDLPRRFEVIRNENALELIQGIDNQNLDSYFEDFDGLAARGLYVYDKLKLDDPEDGLYLLVAYPKYDSRIDKFPFEKNSLSLIPQIGHALISRRDQILSDRNFSPIDLVSTLNRSRKTDE
jgi:hypothetical protein